MSSSQLITNDVEEKRRKRPDAWDYYERVLGKPRHFIAPMVDGSVLPFRVLCRRHGADVGVTPMIYSQMFAKDSTWRKIVFSTCPEDKPVIAQICGHNPDAMVESARLLEGQCAGVDLNLGCPQKVAKKGAYGVFLAENPALVSQIVRRIRTETKICVSCKMRLSGSVEESVTFARMLEDSGCQLLTVHGRTKDAVSYSDAPVDWESIGRVVESVSIPVIANGGIKSMEDAQRCLQVTKAQGVMVGTGLLSNPALFSGVAVPPCELGLELVSLAGEHPVQMPVLRCILVRMMGELLKKYKDLREELVTAGSLDEVAACIREVQRRDAEGVCGSDPFERAAFPWRGDDAAAALSPGCTLLLSLRAAEGYELWCEPLAFARGPHGKSAGGATGGWVIVVGVGKKDFGAETLGTLGESCCARACVLRNNAVYVDIPDAALYAEIKACKRAKVYYRVVKNEDGNRKDDEIEKGEDSPPPCKKDKSDFE